MKVTLVSLDGEDAVARLAARMTVESTGRYVLRYPTRTGALLRVDGRVAGAFDRQHDRVPVILESGEHDVALDVERRSLPTSGLPAGPGLTWWLMQLRAEQRPVQVLDVSSDGAENAATSTTTARTDLTVIGHAHLDVAWLWTYAETRRKAARTFANAVTLMDDFPEYVFTQSQPQLYAWVYEDEPDLFDRVRAHVRTGRFDPSGAAMWVEPDCNVPSGESLLRQLLFGTRYAEHALGVMPSVAWLPDSFGFANTLPTLLAHAGIGCFVTTKLRWNDTTVFPYDRFWWVGPDGSRVMAAVLAAYEGDAEPARVTLARSRDEPLVVGYGDGGGGPTEDIVAASSRIATWTTLAQWFERAALEQRELPTVNDELYLEYHRGVFTTHHDIKAHNAALERSLQRAELALSWMTILRASPFFVEEAKRSLSAAWEVVLRNQFHDVLPGSSIAAVYDDAREQYEHADTLVGRVLEAAHMALPQSPARTETRYVEPRRDDTGMVLENAFLRATLRDDGVLVGLQNTAGRNVVHEGNVLSAYRDTPSKWEAWNIDRGYERRSIRVESLGCDIGVNEVFVRYRIGGSHAAARLSLCVDEPFVRVALVVDWKERRTLLRCENRVAASGASRAFFGSPHGVVERPTDPRTDAERAKYEACGQRFGGVEWRSGDTDRHGDANGSPQSTAGFCLLALDTYGWSVGPHRDGGVRLGHSLLRGTTWPDETADLGEQRLEYALFPTADASHGGIEAAWRRFALPLDGVPDLFSCEDSGIVVVATKPAEDGTGIIVRVRECDGVARDARMACSARAISVESVDALERSLEAQDATLTGGAIHFALPAYALRAFRVAFA